jgi:HEAT repeat protein
VLDVFKNHKIKDVREAAARALLKSGYDGAFDELAPSVLKASWDVQSEFIDGIVRRDPKGAYARLGRFLDPAGFKGKEHVAFAERILSHMEDDSAWQAEPDDEEAIAAAEDAALQKEPSIFKTDPRWVDAAIKLLDHKELMSEALDVIGASKSPKALEPVLKLATGPARKQETWRLLNVLVAYKDPRVAPLLVGFLDLLNGYWGRRTVYRSMREYDDAALVPALEAWFKGKKRLEDRDKNEVTDLLQFLQRDRALTAGV